MIDHEVNLVYNQLDYIEAIELRFISYHYFIR